MGKTFETLRGARERPAVRLAAEAGPSPARAEEEAGVAVLPLPLPPLGAPPATLWPALTEGEGVPFVEVPDRTAARPRAEDAAKTVPFRAPREEGIDWRPI